ncbi:MAG TPA: TolC family protein [Verrucomicrobiae bacterium]|nr:TolC family protein [Verrucomicrobiae bacterium]
MKVICLCAFFFSVFVLASRAEDPFTAASRGLPQEHSHVAPAGPVLTLDALEQIALQANPEIKLAVRRVVTAETHVSGAGSLDDPSFMYRGWQVPLSQPWNYNAAMNMFMVGQDFPGPGKRGLRSQIANDAVAVAKAELEAGRREVSAGVRKAFYDLLRNSDELKVHDEQVAIARQGLEAARIKYSVGKVPQQDVLKAQVDVSKLIEHLVMLEQDAELGRATLNTLLGRNPESPIDVAGQYTLPTELPPIKQLEELALTNRPELSARSAAITQAQDQLKLAKKGYTPDFSANAGYMLMPSGSEHRNNYMIEGSMTLPWLNHRKHDAEIKEAQSGISEQQAEFEAARLMVFQQIQEALVRARAARKLVDLYKKTLTPQTEAALRSTVIAYENDRTDILSLLDSQNTSLDVDYSYFRAAAEFEQRMAELELAVGVPVGRTANPSAEVLR